MHFLYLEIFPFHGLSFQFRVVVVKPMFSLFVNILFVFCLFFFLVGVAKGNFSVHVTHTSILFTWFALLSLQKFKPGALCLICTMSNSL